MKGTYKIDPGKVMGLRFSSRRPFLNIFLMMTAIVLLYAFFCWERNDIYESAKVIFIIFGVIFLFGVLITAFVGYSIEDATLRLEEDHVAQLYNDEVKVTMNYEEIGEVHPISQGILLLRHGGKPHTSRSFHLSFFN